MNGFLSSIFAIVALSGCGACQVRIPNENVSSTPLPYSKVSDYLKSRVQSIDVGRRFYQRNSDGSKLFIKFYFRKGNEAAYRTLIVGGAGVREVSGYAKVWYDDQENPVFRLEGGREWYEDEGKFSRFYSQFDDANYVFKSGAIVPYKEIKGFSGIQGVLGGNLVLIRFRERTAWIVAAPEHPREALVELPKDFEPQAAFAGSNNSLIVFDTYRPQGEEFVRRCLIYRQSVGDYRLAQEIRMPWAAGVWDMYAKTGDALIGGKNNRHMYPTYYHFNIETRRRVLVGFRPTDNILFLKDDVIRTFDTIIRKK